MASFLDNNPTTRDLLSPFGFKLLMKRAPNLSYFIQKINVPGLSLPAIEVPNPLSPSYQSSNRPLFDELVVTFKVNENFDNWLEIWNWMIALGHPTDLDQYKALAANPIYSQKGLESDIIVMILDGQKNPRWEVNYASCRPIALTGLQFESDKNDLSYLTSTATFKYTGMVNLTPVNAPVEITQGTRVEI